MIILRHLTVENFKLLKRVDLAFPRQGSVLVEGLNESGKSTLFESVYYAIYGAPLVTEGRGRGNLDSAIRYGEDAMSVRLLLEIDETELEIQRSVRRGRASQARLAVRRPGEPEQEVTGVLAVNARVVDELGGLDGEALLNSCFVEQKKLSKLEDLASGQRKDSLRKLLNLDRLTSLAEKLRVTLQDERALAEAKARLELAEVSATLPAVAAERARLESALRGTAGVGEWASGGVGEKGEVGRVKGEGGDGDRPGRAGGLSPAAGAFGNGRLPQPDGPHADPLSAGEDRGARAASPVPSRSGSVRPGGGGQATRPTGTGDGAAGPGTGEDARAPRDGSAGASPSNGAWRETADRLAEIRETVAARRQRGLLFGIGAALVAAATLVLYLVGSSVLSWGLPIAFVLALLAWRSYGGAGDLGREIAPLEQELHSRRDVMVAKTGDLEGQRQRVEQMLGVQESDLDVDECRAEVARLSRQIAVKRRAAGIVEGTMERIVRMVLPNTERNLGQILPLLTAGRYHEARIGEDYQVQVWDDSAGRYVSKSIFSGGAKDQFSLALRLAFALATLPEELGTTPGFIFLDEPLSSFDGPRTEALVRLLTEGQVASSFSQIFVISHNRSFDLNAFQYRLVMRDGRVVESNMPDKGVGEWESGRVGEQA